VVITTSIMERKTKLVPQNTQTSNLVKYEICGNLEFKATC
jgi:hypothetical protein